MKPRPPLIAFICLLSIFFSTKVLGQTIGINASAVWLSDCNQSNFFNTSGSGADLIGPSVNIFSNANLGIYTQNSGTFVLRGGEVRTFKDPFVANVCSARMYYRVYLQSGAPGSFNMISLPLLNDCDIPSSQFPSGGPCQAGDQKRNRVISDGITIPYAPVNLTTRAPGNYVLEVYYEITGSSTSTTLCNETITENNGGANYKAFFSIQSPAIASNNPVTCNGSDGFITINGLVPGVAYQLNYIDDGVAVGPLNIVANGSGQIIIIGLDAGVYSNFEVIINGCSTDLFIGTILTNPVFTATFAKIAPFCAGSTPPSLPTVSINGLSGTWNPAVINNQASGTYTFTPTAGQCGIQFSMNVTVLPNTIPTFSFGTSLTICGGGAVPALPATSTNGITGVWNPSTVDNQNSGTYTFTPNSGVCATTTTFTVTINPNLVPTFSFGTSLTICAGNTVPTLPTTSTNGITGVWNPSTVDNQTSGTYTFTPDAGQCATPTNFSMTVNQNVIPTFSFGPSLSVCSGGSVPVLPTTSTNGITGVWTPVVVNNQASGTYTFTPTAGLCALAASFSVTVNPLITPVFSFGTSLSICAGGTVPALPATSNNGITGSWSPAVVDNQNSGTYTFTPTGGSCETTATFTVTVAPNVIPIFSFGTALSVCAGGTVPTLPTASSNGVTGTWNPSTVDNQNSGTYTFTPAAGLCAVPASFTVTVSPNIIPTFSFGNSLTVCAGGTVPALPATSVNGITGTWDPAVVNNQTSGTYTFTASSSGQCVAAFTYTVTVNPILTPTFSFGTSQSICIGAAVPNLPATSLNGINGTWDPVVVNNQESKTYTFTSKSGQCATATATFVVTINEIPTGSTWSDTTVFDGAIIPPSDFSGTPGNVTFRWNNSNPAIGLPESGTGNIPSFTATNMTNDPISATITVTPVNNGCAGEERSYNITVKPLNKDVFVPNVFSPNGDGKNDILFVYGNYIDKVEMRIFNQWGELVQIINSRTRGWDGTHRGKPQPVGVYVYVLKAVLSYGKTVEMKGSITLLR